MTRGRLAGIESDQVPVAVTAGYSRVPPDRCYAVHVGLRQPIGTPEGAACCPKGQYHSNANGAGLPEALIVLEICMVK